MAYIGNNPDSVLQGRKALYTITATAGQTVFSGLDDNGNTIDLLQAESNNVYLNGSRLVDTADFTLNGDVLTLTSGAASGDIMVITTEQEMGNAASYTKAASDSRYINYDGDIVNGTIQMGGGPGNNITFADNNKIVMGDSNDFEIYHYPDVGNYIKGAGTYGNININAHEVKITDNGSNTVADFSTDNGSARLYWAGSGVKLATTTTGIDITGDVVVSGTVDGRDIAADGTKLDTVETNADVTDTTNVSAAGALMTTGGTMTGALIADDITSELTLAAIAKDISDTAVDIFVYNTAKDSDGGAWRKRTQHTSWYNETLGTATRGSRKEFPAVAVIVAEAAKVTIYDGDDPAMPMWMVFNKVSISSNVGNIIHGYGTTGVRPLSAVVAKDGYLVPVESGSSGCVYKLSFIADRCEWITENTTYGGFYNGDIGSRNAALGYQYFGTGVGLNIIVARVVNDVAMTVLPNAPIDAATGLPVPTIAVATDGGVSVIKEDGTVVDYTGTSQGSDASVDQISFIGNSKLLFSHRYASEVVNLISTDNTSAYYNSLSSWTGRITNSISHGDTSNVSALSSDDNIESIALNEEDAASKSVSGLSLANHYQVPNDPDRIGAYITSDYSTGWMNGDIKLATLSDTDATNVTGAELLANNLTANVTGWASPGGTIVWNASGYADVTRGAGQGPYVASHPLGTTLTIGEVYTVTANIVTNNGGGNSLVRFGSSTAGGQVTDIETGTGILSATFTATAAHTHMWLYSLPSTTTSFKEVYVRKAEQDRSVNGNGLQVFGTITKTAVATGADLVGYSGFSTTGSKVNYLRMPYASVLDFDTSFCFMGWIKIDGAVGTQDQHFFDMINDDNSNRIDMFYQHSTTNFYITPANGGSNVGSAAVSLGQWYHVVALANTSTTDVYVNGELSGTGAGGFNHTWPNGSVTLGTRFTEYNSSAFGLNGSMALIRLSKSTPSAAQIAKIYNDEKHLFQAGAQATLYGTSDAVTALAYDDDTELLHVGTSAGRSVFQGLRRIDNTTDAVGVAISASNGMVAED